MALKQQTAPFQLRNPYRLDRPSFDPSEVWANALADEEDHQRIQHHNQQIQIQIQNQERPLPPQPTHPKHPHHASLTTSTSHLSEDSSISSLQNHPPIWHGVSQVSNGIKRIRDYQRRNSLKGSSFSTKHSSKQKDGQPPMPQTSDLGQEITQPAPTGGHSALQRSDSQQDQQSYFSQSWFGRSSSLSISNAVKQQQQQQQKQLLQLERSKIPTITISHHIDTHAELTFERHVEWLTQTALWWDMPLVHLYPAPESASTVEYVERAASRFASWVNFVKIPAGEESRLGPLAGAPPMNHRRSSSKSSKRSRISRNKTGTDVEEVEEGGLVRSLLIQSLTDTLTTAESSGSGNSVEPVVGYVFVGSSDEQSQYHHVLETMEKLYPKLTIRYINSFEPQHQQSRQQQELREDPCIHSLSWMHYWSAAKESQVLQSKIMNDVVRARPMWVNPENLSRNYVPPVLPPLSLPSTVASPMDSLEDDSFLMTDPSMNSLLSSSVYLGNSDEAEFEDGYDNSRMSQVFRGLPSSVSISSLADVDSDSIMTDVDTTDTTTSTQDHNQHFDEEDGLGSTEESKDPHQMVEMLHELQYPSVPRRRPSLNRTQSTMDIRHDNATLDSDTIDSGHKVSGKRSKKWSLAHGSISTSSFSLTSSSDSNGKNTSTSGPVDKKSCRRSASSPLLFTSSSKSNGSTLSMNSGLSNASSSSSSSQEGSGLGHRLAGFAQRLGVYRMRGSSMMLVHI